MALEDPREYFVAFDTLTNPSSLAPNSEDILFVVPASKRTAEQTYLGSITRLTLAGIFSAPGSLHSFDLSLSLHAATPAIEAFYQYYNEVLELKGKPNQASCSSWVDWKGERICDEETLKERLKTAGPGNLDTECVPYIELYPE